jgi:hypothetical protein
VEVGRASLSSTDTTLPADTPRSADTPCAAAAARGGLGRGGGGAVRAAITAMEHPLRILARMGCSPASLEPEFGISSQQQHCVFW